MLFSCLPELLGCGCRGFNLPLPHPASNYTHYPPTSNSRTYPSVPLIKESNKTYHSLISFILLPDKTKSCTKALELFVGSGRQTRNSLDPMLGRECCHLLLNLLKLTAKLVWLYGCRLSSTACFRQ